MKVKAAVILSICHTFLLAGCSSQPTGPAELGSVLPIRVGIYVDESQTSSEPANAGMLSFDGQSKA
jgi:hypothetical protein